MKQHKSKTIPFSDDYKKVLASMKNLTTHTFVIGKGGSGKTYLMNYFIFTHPNDTIVVAPTGLAASNLKDGLTIHKSFFFRIGIATGGMVHSTNKPDWLIEKAKYLIIDEISMVRADLFSAINQRLQEVRKCDAPFGGIKVILVGDPFQLEPVTDEDDQPFLQHYLNTDATSHYFFQSPAFRNSDFQKSLEIFSLEHSYRQNLDPRFLTILDNIRIGKIVQEDIDTLNSRFSANDGRDWPALTTTKRTSKDINDVRREMIEGDEFTHYPEVRYFPNVATNHYNVVTHPAFEPVCLKVGEAVVITRNDPNGLYVNGSVGVVETVEKSPEDDDLRVNIKLLNGMTIPIHPMTFDVIQPYLSGHKVFHRTLALITNLPLIPSSAMTIHKAQGQTLEKLAIDLGFGAFANGQLYVALSRVRKLEDLILYTKIKLSDIKVNPLVVEFMAAIQDRIFHAF